jgi:hypothetical protein
LPTNIDTFNIDTIVEINGIQRRTQPIIFTDTQIERRLQTWTGALNGNTGMGCGINVLKFIRAISPDDTLTFLATPEIVNPVTGLSIHNMVLKFNLIFQQRNINRVVVYFSMPIRLRADLTAAFNYFNTILVPDSYMIVRYGRHVDPAQRGRREDPEILQQYPEGVPLSDGHYVLVAKLHNGQLITVDPHISQTRDSTVVSDNFWNAWHHNGYVSMEILQCYDPTVIAGGSGSGSGSGSGIIIQEVAYIAPKQIMKQFEKDLLASYECVKPVNTRSKQSKTKAKRPLIKNKTHSKSKNKNSLTVRRVRSI